MFSRSAQPRTRRIALTLIVLAAQVMPFSAVAEERYLVRLSVRSLVRQALRDDFPTTPSGRLDFDDPQAQEHLAEIDEEQREFLAELADVAPQARVDREYRVLLNGLVVAGVTETQLNELPQVWEVRRTDTIRFELAADLSAPLIGAPTMWQALGGPADAGRGIKIAIIDSGIDPFHPFFDPRTFAMPDGFPVGEVPYSSAKVIAARAYFRPDDPVDPTRDEATPQDLVGHGSHVAGIAAGVHDLGIDPEGGQPLHLSGVAPGAHLMNYKAFYRAQSGSTFATEPEVIAALEDAVLDGADVILAPFAAPDVLGDDVRSSEAFRAAINAGVVVVTAAGNNKSAQGMVQYPGSLENLLTVGATATGRFASRWLGVVSPQPVPWGLNEIPLNPIDTGFTPDEPVRTLPVMTADQASNGVNPTGCAAYDYSVLSGFAALVPAGECSPQDKIGYAFLAGAAAVIIFGAVSEHEILSLSPIPIRAVRITAEAGLSLEKWLLEQEGTLIELHDVQAFFFDETIANQQSELTPLGPTETHLLKPELLAPGEWIISAAPGTGGWHIGRGTSMAAAQVAGAAALVKQRYATWTPQTVKSALIGSASYLSPPSGSSPVGRLDLAASAAMDVTAYPATLSWGDQSVGDSFDETIEITSRSTSFAPLTVKWEHAQAHGITAFPADGAIVEPDTPFEVRMEVSTTAPFGSYHGFLHIQAEQTAQQVTLPYRFDVRPSRRRSLAIVDMSFAKLNGRDLADVYTRLAQHRGIDWELITVDPFGEAPALSQLLDFQTILAFTGDDQQGHRYAVGAQTIDLLASFLNRGGRLIVTGQGPWRDLLQDRLQHVLGVRTNSGLPLRDPRTGQLIELASYRAQPIDDVIGLTLPVDLDPTGDGQGDLAVLGELEPIWGPGLPALYVTPFLKMEHGPFQAGGNVGLRFDPFAGHGKHTEAKYLTGRGIVLGFGLERVNSNVEGTTTRQELFDRLYDWVSDRLDIRVRTKTWGTRVTFTVTTRRGKFAQLAFDFNDDTPVVVTDHYRVEHDFDSLGTKEVTIIGTSPLGHVDIDTIEVELDAPEESSTDRADGGTAEFEDPRFGSTLDCQCGSLGKTQAGLFTRLMSLLF